MGVEERPHQVTSCIAWRVEQVEEITMKDSYNERRTPGASCAREEIRLKASELVQKIKPPERSSKRHPGETFRQQISVGLPALH